LANGEIDLAADKYQAMITVNQSIPSIILDLQEAVEQLPNEVSLWHCLGDALMRANQVQEALAAYTKAEKLLR